jgi:beta-lactamase class A
MIPSRLVSCLRAALLTLCLTPLAPALAQTAPSVQPATSAAGSTQAALQRVFSAQTLKPAWFSDPSSSVLSQVQTVVRSFLTQYGRLQQVESVEGDKPDSYRLSYERGQVTVTATSDASGAFTALQVVGQMPSQSDPAAIKALERLVSGSPVEAAWFAPSFLAQVPVAQLQTGLAQLLSGLGAFQKVSYEKVGSGGGYVLKFQNARLPVKSLALDAQGRFTGLLLGLAQSSTSYSTLNEVVAAINALPGQKSLLVRKITPQGVQELAALNSGTRLGVGSAFKLAILAELQAQVKAGKLSWTKGATLQDFDKSLPSGTLQNGTLQNEPSGKQFTLEALAEAMISASDNTAADLLLRTVGRSGVEDRLGESPMLNTRELFALKNPANAILLSRYRAARGQARRAVIAQAARAALPTSGTVTLALYAEWHVSTRGLCSLMNEVADLPLTTINPGVVTIADFDRISFKGGSDDGVLNLTTQVLSKKGETYCVSATWNDTQPLSQVRLSLLFNEALRLIK